LEAKDWYVVPQILRVPQDLYFYAVDQKEIDAKAPPDPMKDKDKEKEPKLASWFQFPKDGQTVLQIHKWLEALHLKGRSQQPVGDWVIAERVVAARGEPIGEQRVEVPYWRTTQDKFTMYADSSPPAKPELAKKWLASVEVTFMPENEEPILVDYRGGEADYTRTHPRSGDAAPLPAEPQVQDKAPHEVLLYTADGKLLAHSAAQDAADRDRAKRVEDARKWIEEIKKAKGGKDSENWFGPTGPGPK
jgi:hypothetical protein